VTKIPEEHRAARDLYDSFAALGEQEAARRASASRGGWWRRWRMRRAFGVVPVALLTLVAAAGAGRVLFDDDAVLPGDRGAPSETRRAERDAALAAVRAADPDGGLPWGIRLYTSANGGRCAIPGRVRGQALGVMRRGQFLPMAADDPGTCGSAGAHMLIARVENAEAPARSILFGFVDRSVRAMSIVGGGRRRTVPVAADGSFLVVTKRRIGGQLRLHTGGRTIRRELG
jgi:hypothetical protein